MNLSESCELLIQYLIYELIAQCNSLIQYVNMIWRLFVTSWSLRKTFFTVIVKISQNTVLCLHFRFPQHLNFLFKLWQKFSWLMLIHWKCYKFSNKHYYSINLVYRNFRMHHFCVLINCALIIDAQFKPYISIKHFVSFVSQERFHELKFWPLCNDNNLTSKIL